MTYVVVAGKGWSLDRAPWQRLRGIADTWFAVNEAAIVVARKVPLQRESDEIYVFTSDTQPMERVRATGFQYAGEFLNPAIFHVEMGVRLKPLYKERRYAISRLPTVATAPYAIALAGIFGFKAALMVGFDSLFGKEAPSWALPCLEHPTGQPYARSCTTDLGFPNRRREGARYSNINEDIRQAARWFGVTLESVEG